MLGLALASPHLSKMPSVNLDTSVNRRNSEDTIDEGDEQQPSVTKDNADLEAGGDRKVPRHQKSVKHIDLAWDLSLLVPTTRAELKKTGSKTKVLLDHVTGEVKSGQMLAVMGSSGAGKSTFLDCVSMRNQNFGGNVFVNGHPADESFYFMTAYVYQEDLFYATMTVREHLIYHAMVRMDSKIPVEERMLKIEDVLVEVAMQHASETKIGGPGSNIRGISGGERKRLAFGTELLMDPSIIFADEPTSGLDSFMTRGVCTTMRRLANEGRIIMCVIHQPSSQTFDLFTDLLLLARGKTVYMGPISELDNYFSRMDIKLPAFVNPADFYIQQVAVIPTQQEESMERLEKLWQGYSISDMCKKNSAWKQQMDKEVLYGNRRTLTMRHFHASFSSQFYYTMKRNIETQFRQPTELKAKMLNSLVMGLILGTIYYGQDDSQTSAKNLLGLFFILIMYQTMVSMFSVLQVFPSEMKIFVRENLSGATRVSSYFLSRTLAELPLSVIFPIIYGTIVYWMVGLEPDLTRFVVFTINLVLVANASVSLGYMISAMTSHESVALALAPLFLMPMALFAGLLLDLSRIPVFLRWLDFLSIIKYGYQVLMINQYYGNDLNCKGSLFCRWPTGDAVMEYVGTAPQELTRNLALTILLLVGFRMLAYAFLVIKTNKKP